VVVVLERLGGAASWRQLRRAGVSWYSLWSALRDGRVERLRRGAYALPSCDPAVRAAVLLGGVLACTSAALALGLPVLVPHGIHVVVPRDWSHARHKGVTVHRRCLPAQDREGITTSLLRTVVDCARELPLREAVVICDAALRAGLDHGALRAAALATRGLGSRAIRAVAAAADGRAESPIESCLRLIAQQLGRVDAQVWISGVGRVDLVLDGWLVLEADGFEFHSDRRSYREDRRRGNALVAAGYTILRFGYEDIVHNEDMVRCLVADVLARGPHGLLARGRHGLLARGPHGLLAGDPR
jgi:very-short-patch-repair endonuclease